MHGIPKTSNIKYSCSNCVVTLKKRKLALHILFKSDYESKQELTQTL